jgi:NAD-dependent deacetylase
MPDLLDLLQGARRVLIFTGAGISTGSGIPDFRGPTGIWHSQRPVTFSEFMESEDKRIEYWEYKRRSYVHFAAAQPNATHLAVVELQRMGRLEAVVTQNIDGLHQLAGLADHLVVEVHGTNRRIECTLCGARSDPEAAFRRFEQQRRAPRCRCGGWLKPATISFGQRLNPNVLARAFDVAKHCDLVVALGSTLSVEPAASIPLAAYKRGVPYVVVNQGATEHDGICSLRIEADVADVLPPAVRALRES